MVIIICACSPTSSKHSSFSFFLFCIKSLEPHLTTYHSDKHIGVQIKGLLSWPCIGQNHHKDVLCAHMTYQNLNNSSYKLRCQERGSRTRYLAPLHVCDEKSSFGRSCDHSTYLFRRFNKLCGRFNNPPRFLLCWNYACLPYVAPQYIINTTLTLMLECSGT